MSEVQARPTVQQNGSDNVNASPVSLLSGKFVELK
jgi:hypothetical protein